MSLITKPIDHMYGSYRYSLFTPGSMQFGFLPDEDPATSFQRNHQFKLLDVVGHNLPSRLEYPNFRKFARTLNIPLWDANNLEDEDLSEVRLYYVRVGFLASAYINQVGQQTVRVLPENIAKPLCDVCRLLKRPPILSYDGYVLYNWKRFDKCKAITLGNIDTIQNFVHLYDEHWFILVHVEIEAIAIEIIQAINHIHSYSKNKEIINEDMLIINNALKNIIKVLQRIPEKMSSSLYYKTFRPYIRYFENVVYENVNQAPINYRGETGAQSTIMPALVAFMKIPHRQSELTMHLKDMRKYMPIEHRSYLAAVENIPDIRSYCDCDIYNKILESMARFREVHYGWAEEYINKWTNDLQGTGGTPYMKWLKQLIDETRAHMH